MTIIPINLYFQLSCTVLLYLSNLLFIFVWKLITARTRYDGADTCSMLRITMKKILLFVFTLLFVAVASTSATTFGPLQVVRCPHCNEVTMKYYPVTSGDSLSSTCRSDGYVHTPGHPQAPVVVKCPRCDSYVVLKDHLHDGSAYLTADGQETEEAATLMRAEACEPDFIGYMEAFTVIEDVRVACLSAIHSFNHQFATADPMSERVSDPGMWAWKERLFRKAVTQLLPMLDEADASECLLKAELLREIGAFDGCVELLGKRKRSLDKPQRKIAERIIAEAKRENPRVFQL